MTETIPGPRTLPLIGNLLDIWEDRSIPIRGLERLASIYGPIYQVTVNGQRRIVCSSAALLEELTDEKRFVKVPPPTLAAIPGPKGLFIARNEDPDWAQGHRILMPAFAPLSVQEMFADMKDIANQLILSWARKGPENRILATEDFSKLTLDTIALCTMSYRFNSFYSDTMHPFIEAMNFIFKVNTAKTSRPAFIQSLMFKTNAQFSEARKTLQETGKKIIADRRATSNKKDVLDTMIYGTDSAGETMRDELIVEQMVTFLVAGHETTSGMLSFAIMQLLRSPEAYLKAQKEVDEVIGSRAIEAGDIHKFKYLNAVLRETSRLSPTVPILQKRINPDTAHQIVTVGGYKIEPTDHLVIMVGNAQRDPKVWGNTAEDFNPDRMLDENFDKITAEYPGCWKVSCTRIYLSNLTFIALRQWQASLYRAAIRLARSHARPSNDFTELRRKIRRPQLQASHQAGSDDQTRRPLYPCHASGGGYNDGRSNSQQEHKGRSRSAEPNYQTIHWEADDHPLRLEYRNMSSFCSTACFGCWCSWFPSRPP